MISDDATSPDDPREVPTGASEVWLRQNPGPPPMQFRLKSLLAATAALCVVFALAGRLTGLGLAALVWFLSLVAAHMAATVIGTRSVSHAPMRGRGPGEAPGDEGPEGLGGKFDPARDCAPTTRLGRTARFGIWFWAGIVLGAALGCVVGSLLVGSHHGRPLSWPAFTLAAFSSAGIGAFLSFLAGSCARVAGRAFREAAHSAGPRR